MSRLFHLLPITALALALACAGSGAGAAVIPRSDRIGRTTTTSRPDPFAGVVAVAGRVKKTAGMAKPESEAPGRPAGTTTRPEVPDQEARK